MRIIGIDPGLLHTGYGVIQKDGQRLIYKTSGIINPDASLSLAERLSFIFKELTKVLEAYSVDAASVEETFVNVNPRSTLKLGQARGAALLAPAVLGIPVYEYATNTIKKNVTGVGHAEKQQISLMVKTLLSGYVSKGVDADDALAAAICCALMA